MKTNASLIARLWEAVREMRIGLRLPGHIAVVREAIAALEKSSWISVENRLPEPFDTVLISVLTKNGHDEPTTIETLGSYEHGKWEPMSGCSLCEGETVTHWMPMPEPPAIEKKTGTEVSK